MDAAHAINDLTAQPELSPVVPELSGPAALLRGTARGLEVVVNGRASAAAITAALTARLEEAPAFFRGSDVKVSVEDGPLAPGCLARLDDLATTFALRITEVVATAVPKPNLAAGSAPTESEFSDEERTNTAISVVAADVPIELSAGDLVPETATDVETFTALAALANAERDPGFAFEEPTQAAIPLALAATPETELHTASGGTRLVVGPVRSGVILDHTGHVVVFGDVNPGAEVRATGNIMVLGRLRGTAHAAIGQDVGFILALRLEPQQLRIGRMVARAADSDTPAAQTEIAYANGDGIVVEQYLGKLPRNLATSL